MSIIKMYAAVVAGVQVAVNIDIPANGIIRTVTLGGSFTDTAPATGNQFIAELSFLSASQFSTNDVRGSICQVNHTIVHANLAATLAVAFVSGTPFCILTPIAIKVAAGERIYLHLDSGGGTTGATAVAYLFVDDGIDVARAQVRRR